MFPSPRRLTTLGGRSESPRDRIIQGRHRVAPDLDARAWAYLGRNIDEAKEIACLQMGADPLWERPHDNGEDITDQPDRWTPYQRARRESFEARVERYRAEGRL